MPRRVDPSWQLLIACNSMPSHTLEPALLGRTFLDMRRVRFTTNPTEVDESKNIYPAGSLPPKLHEWLLALLIELPCRRRSSAVVGRRHCMGRSRSPLLPARVLHFARSVEVLPSALAR